MKKRVACDRKCIYTCVGIYIYIYLNSVITRENIAVFARHQPELCAKWNYYKSKEKIQIQISKLLEKLIVIVVRQRFNWFSLCNTVNKTHGTYIIDTYVSITNVYCIWNYLVTFLVCGRYHVYTGMACIYATILRQRYFISLTSVSAVTFKSYWKSSPNKLGRHGI